MTTPLEFCSQEPGYRLATEAYPLAAYEPLRPRAPLSPAQRLSVYNRQYWFRLFTVLQEALEQVASSLDPESLAFLQENLQPWFAHWASLGWFLALSEEEGAT